MIWQLCVSLLVALSMATALAPDAAADDVPPLTPEPEPDPAPLPDPDDPPAQPPPAEPPPAQPPPGDDDDPPRREYEPTGPSRAAPLVVPDERRLPEYRPRDAFGRIEHSGRGHFPRVVYQSPPFTNDDYWSAGGIIGADRPQLFLWPTRLDSLIDFTGDLGGRVETRIMGDALMSFGAEMYTLLRRNRHGDFWRLQIDFSMLAWLTPQVALEFGPLLGFERDVLLVNRFDNDIEFFFGAHVRATIWRFTLRAEWLMRLDLPGDLGYGDVRHAVRLQADLEVARVDIVGFEVGGWFSAVTGGPPRVGLSLGLRFWFSFDRDTPEWAARLE